MPAASDVSRPRQAAGTDSQRTNRTGKSLANGCTGALAIQQGGGWTRPELLVCGGAPRRNRTGDPILTIDARGFTTPCDTSDPHTSAQVRSAVGGSCRGRGEVAWGVVSGKFLVRPLLVSPPRTP